MMKTVGIIGGAGYIGSYVTRQLLAEGFQVKVSARDIKKEDHYQHLKSFEKAENLALVSMDLRVPNSVKEFIKGCEIIVHTGTPFHLNVEDPQKDFFEPTVQGTKDFLDIIKGQEGLEKVVFVASVAAYNTAFPMPAAGRADDHLYTEEDTPYFHESNHPYAQSKYFADQAIRKFLDENPDLPFEIVSVSPTGVMGPALSRREDSTSMGIQYLFKNHIAPDPFVQMMFDQDIYFAVVDVADVGQAICKAATLDGLHGKNYLLSTDSWRVSDLGLMLNKKEPKGPSKTVYSNALASRELGIQFHSAEVPLNQYP